MNHKYLVDRAEKWLKGTMGCSVVISELVSYAGEIPDAIGFKSFESILVECKASRADFLKDKKKWFRRKDAQGMGQYRFYMCPPEIIKIEDLPDGWGLLWCIGKTVKQVKGFKGNLRQDDDIKHFDACIHAERTLLVSQLRRTIQKQVFNKR